MVDRSRLSPSASTGFGGHVPEDLRRVPATPDTSKFQHRPGISQGKTEARPARIRIRRRRQVDFATTQLGDANQRVP